MNRIITGINWANDAQIEAINAHFPESLFKEIRIGIVSSHDGISITVTDNKCRIYSLSIDKIGNLNTN